MEPRSVSSQEGAYAEQNRHYADLISVIQGNDKAAASAAEGALWSESRKYILYVLQLRGVDPQDAEDEMQECFIVVMCAIRNRSLRDPGRFKPFLNTILYRHAANYIREKVGHKKEMAIDDPEGSVSVLDASDLSCDVIEQLEKKNLLSRAIGMIKNPRRKELMRRVLLQEPKLRTMQEMRLSERAYAVLKNRICDEVVHHGRVLLSKEETAKSRRYIPPIAA